VRISDYVRLIVAFYIAAVLPGQARADEYPDRPIKSICPYAPGALPDILTRLLAKRLSERVRQPVLVENRTGAGGIVAMERVAKSLADGYSLVLVGQGMASVNPVLYKKLARGMTAVGTSSEAFGRYIQDEMSRWRKVGLDADRHRGRHTCGLNDLAARWDEPL